MEQTLTIDETLEAVSIDAALAGTAPVSFPESSKVLESAARNATLWTVLDYGMSQSVRVVNSLILTRLLVPNAFGELGLLTTLIVGMTLLSDIGLAPSIIQSPRGDDPAFLNTAWSLQAMRGGLLWLVSLVLALPAAHFYHDPALAKLLPVLALTTVLSGFNGTSLLTLSRHMGVRRLFAIDLSAQIFSLMVTVTWAYLRPSVWALVAGTLAASAYRLVLSHVPAVTPGHRNRFQIERASLHQIVRFGKWIFLGTAFFFFASQADRLVLARLISMSMLGVYSIAFQISDIPRAVISAFASKVGFPFASKLAHLPLDEFRENFHRYRLYVLLLGAVLLSVMVTWGGFIITLVYPRSFADAQWMIPILALGLWHTLLYNTTSPALLALGVSTYNAAGNLLYCGTMLVGIPVAFHYYGLLGALVAVAAGDFPLYLVTQIGAARRGLQPFRQDLLLTLMFLTLLAVELTARKVL